jgi:hypothetical protein
MSHLKGSIGNSGATSTTGASNIVSGNAASNMNNGGNGTGNVVNGTNNSGNVVNASGVNTSIGNGGVGMASGIVPQSGGKLNIPSGAPKLPGGMKLNIAPTSKPVMRKPHRTEKFKVAIDMVDTMPLLVVKAMPPAVGDRLYHVTQELSGHPRIASELRDIVVIPSYSIDGKHVFLWWFTVSDTDWYRSLAELFNQPVDFATSALLVQANKALGCYQAWATPDTTPVTWPTKTTRELVADALAPGQIITSADHPVYANLTSGTVLI